MTKEQFITFKEDLKKAIEVVKLENKWQKEWWNCGFKTREDYDKANAERWKKCGELRNSIVCRFENVKWSYEERKYIPKGTTSPVPNAEAQSTHNAYYIAKHRLTDEEAVEYMKKSLAHTLVYRNYSDEDITKVANSWYKDIKEGILAAYEKLDVKSE